MNANLIRVLIVEDNPGDARLLREILSEDGRGSFDCACADRLSAVPPYLASGYPDTILLDLGLPDSQGIGTLKETLTLAGEIPIIVLTGLSDESVGLEAVRLGAQDYLIKGELQDRILLRVIQYAVERANLKKSLWEANQRFSLMVEQLNDVVWTASPDGSNVIDITETFERVYGRPASEYRLNPQLWMDMVHPADIEIAKASTQELSNKGKAAAEYRIIRPDGTVRWVLDRKSLLYDKKGDIILMGGIGTDITDRKQAEASLRLQAELLDMESDSVDVHDFEGNILYANRAFYSTLGYSAQELANVSVHQLCDEASKELIPTRLKEISERGLVLFTTRHRRKDGSWVSLEIHSSLIRLDDNNVIMSVGRDISERLGLQEKLILTDRLASIGQLAAGIAHELNNPLTGVIGFSDLLMGRRDLPDDIRTDLEVINKEAARAAGVVKGLLTFARKQKTDRAALDLLEVIRSVLQLRTYEHKVSNIEVETRFAPDLPQVMGNAAQLQQVFINIIINAEQAMLEAHKRGKLVVTAGRAGDMLRISFADDGPGIKPENMTKLFTPFFTTKPVGKGTGLGLSICHGIIADHGGTLRAESEYGKGAAFIIELPIAGGLNPEEKHGNS